MDKYANSLTGVLWLVLCVGLALALLSVGLVYGGFNSIKKLLNLGKIEFPSLKFAK